MKMILLIYTLINSFAFAEDVIPVKEEKKEVKKEQVLDFSAGVIEGELNRPSMLMELGSNYKEFNDLILLREDFNVYHEIDSSTRFRYVDENL